jgi:hypothetical protein
MSGVVVMAAGIAALVGMARGPEPGIEANPDAGQAMSVTTSSANIEPGLEGIAESVQRTLKKYGVIGGLDLAEQSELNPVIVRVLEEFGVTLAVPIADEPNL